MSLITLTLPLVLLPGQSSIARAQWQFNIGTLEDVPPQSMRLVRLVVNVPDNDMSPDIRIQVKQIRWKALVAQLGRFPSLKKLIIVIKGGDGQDCELWQDVEACLRREMAAMHLQVRITREYGYAL